MNQFIDYKETIAPEDQSSSEKAVILFTRVPIPGMTKTRLEKLLTQDECAELHTCFLYDLKALCEQTQKDFFVFYTPAGEEEWITMSKIFGSQIPLHLQQGKDIGERMFHAISTVLAMGYDGCVLIGADIPELQLQDFISAFEVLQHHDIVLGPTVDHGYCLVGMKKPQQAVFEVQTYGTGDVLENTISAIGKAGLTYGLIQMHEDIDEPADIPSFQKKVDDGLLDDKSHTAAFIMKLVQKYEDRLAALE